MKIEDLKAPDEYMQLFEKNNYFLSTTMAIRDDYFLLKLFVNLLIARVFNFFSFDTITCNIKHTFFAFNHSFSLSYSNIYLKQI